MRAKQAKKNRLWYLQTPAGVQGPFPSGSIRRSLLLGRLKPSDRISDDETNWRAISDSPELIPAELHLAEQGDRAPLIMARRREDERNGLDRRGTVRERSPEQERRKAEPAAVQRHRLAKTDLRQRTERQATPFAGLAAIALIVMTAVGYGFYHGGPVSAPDPDCSAQPAVGVDWRNCRLDGLVAETAQLRRAILGNALLRGARMPGSDFSAADLQYTDLSDSDLSHGDFRRARMKGATLRNVDLSYADLSAADLRFADLSGANLGGALLHRVRLDSAIWVDGGKCAADSIGECRR